MVRHLALRVWAFSLIMLAGFVWTFLAFYPGLMSPDSEDQLSQASRFAFSDGHPIVMALIWAGTNAIVRGPVGFFVLLLLMYWGGFLLICSSLASRSGVSFWSSVMLPFLPFLINFSGTLWKDVLVFGCFLLAVGILLYYRGRKQRIPIVVAICVFILIITGAMARYNSVLSAIPLTALLFWPHAACDAGIGSIARRFAAAFVVVLLSVVAVTATLNALLRPEKTYTSSQLLMFDLVGVSNRSGLLLLPGRWTDEESRAIRQCYHPRTWDFIRRDCDFAVSRLRAEDRWGRLFGPWLRAVLTHPREYAAHRLAYVGAFFQRGFLVFASVVTKGSYDHGLTKNILFKAIEAFIMTSVYTFPFSILFASGFWFLVAPLIFLLHMSFFRRDPAAMYPGLLVSASGVLYTAPLAVVGLSHEFRYMYWGIAASCVASVLAADVCISSHAEESSDATVPP